MAKTPPKRKLTPADHARNRADAIVKAGGRRLSLLLPPEGAALLAAAQKETGASATAVILAALRAAYQAVE